MNDKKIFQVTAYAASVVMLAGALSPKFGAAQSLQGRLEQIGDGEVRMQYAARQGVCSSADGFRMVRTDESDSGWVADCRERKVLLALTFERGSISGFDLHVGGSWRRRTDVVDLGVVGVREIVPWLIDLASTADGELASEALGAAAIADSVDIVPDLTLIVRDSSRPHSLRRSAVFWLGNIGSDAAIPVLEEVVRQSRYADVAETGLFALATHGGETAELIVRDIALNADGAPDLRQHAIFWLGQGDIRDIEFLKSLFYRIEQEDLRERVIFAVAQGDDSAAEEWLLGLVENETLAMDLRNHALFWYGQQGSVERLVDILESLPERELRERAVFVISQKRNDEAAISALISIAENDAEPEIQRKAIFWLGQMDHERAVEYLARLINGGA
ncbi:MAG: HEAT repeat domain-containing protein [Gemmatimonadota bacterium]|nr:HEAT repeat domain-containing protein [Gemmatimonadota bacterium]